DPLPPSPPSSEFPLPPVSHSSRDCWWRRTLLNSSCQSWSPTIGDHQRLYGPSIQADVQEIAKADAGVRALRGVGIIARDICRPWESAGSDPDHIRHEARPHHARAISSVGALNQMLPARVFGSVTPLSSWGEMLRSVAHRGR